MLFVVIVCLLFVVCHSLLFVACFFVLLNCGCSLFGVCCMFVVWCLLLCSCFLLVVRCSLLFDGCWPVRVCGLVLFVDVFLVARCLWFVVWC